MENQERRTTEAIRAPLETIVEICGSDSTVPPFEAETVDVSGRGMHVRTAYLPAPGAPLVCRFHHQGEEVLVEGIVAWRVEHTRGGDFGVQFTAIDKASVQVLRTLCDETEGSGRDEADLPEGEEELVGLGRRVRLHIDGLNAPMKAAVRDGSSRKVRVGSNLEFLRVGRRLELEDQDERGDRRAASIDAVDVVIEPQSGVPQLMVTLRLEGEKTPEPSVVDLEGSDANPGKAAGKPTARTEEESFEQDVEAEGEKLERRLKGQVSVMASRAGSVLQCSGGLLGDWGQKAASKAGQMAQQTLSNVGSLTKGRSKGTKGGRRVTAPAPQGGYGQRRVRSTEGLRTQRPSAASNQAHRTNSAAPNQRGGGNARRAAESSSTSTSRRGRRLVALIGGAGALGLLSVLALRAASLEDAEQSAESTAVSSAAAPVAPAAAAKTTSSAPAITPGARLPAKPAGPAKTKDGIIAKVPLFGDMKMVPTEPVPLGAPAEEEQAQGREVALSRVKVPDQVWDDKPKGKADPTAVKPWGRGRLNLPTRHELALNAPGGGLEGKVEPTGFSVFIPDRKVLGDPSAITRRDPRIVNVTKKEGPDGTRVRFRFRDAVPAYKARLRGENIEFFISAP